jgi:regulatory protein
MTRSGYLSFDDILNRMAAWCAYRDRSTAETERKLDEFNLLPEARDRILARLIEEDFLDDLRFARAYARGKFYHNRWGKQKIIHGLRQHRLTDYYIRQALTEIPDADYEETIRKLIRRKAESLSGLPPARQKQKISRYLYGKGYRYPEFKNILDEAF